MNIDLMQAWYKIQGMVNAGIALVPNLVLALLIFALFFLLARVVKRGTKEASTKLWHSPNLSAVLGRLAQLTCLLMGTLISLTIVIPTFQASSLVTLLGVSGVAIGFAFRDILQNFLAGILILITDPFRINDQIIVEKYEGTVEDIQTRATLIRTYDGRRVVIPNADLFTKTVIVNTACAARRSEYKLNISLEADTGQARSVILKALQGTSGVLEEPPPAVLAVGFNDIAIELQARWWTAPQNSQVTLIKDEVIAAIKDALAENKIELALTAPQILLMPGQTPDPASSEG